jgi:hypothetical protein
MKTIWSLCILLVGLLACNDTRTGGADNNTNAPNASQKSLPGSHFGSKDTGSPGKDANNNAGGKDTANY